MAYNQKTWEIAKRYADMSGGGHYLNTCGGPCCHNCRLIYQAVDEALRTDSTPAAVAAYRLGYAEGNKADDPELDGTDFAHPAYLRGEDATVKKFCKIVNDILDGTKANVGTASGPWQQLRQRLYDIRTLLGIAERIVDQASNFATFKLNTSQWYKIRNDYAKRLAEEKKMRYTHQSQNGRVFDIYINVAALRIEGDLVRLVRKAEDNEPEQQTFDPYVTIAVVRLGEDSALVKR